VLLRTGIAFAAGLVLSLAFEPVAVAYVMPVALAGFALTTRGLGPRRAWLPGLAFGAGFYFVTAYWMRGSIGTDAWIGMSTAEALFYGLLGAGSGVLQRLRFWPVWLAAAWATMEVARSGWPFSGMPFGRLAFAVVDTPVAQALPYAGSTGLSFLLALIGFLLAWVILERDRSDRLVAAGILAAVTAAVSLPALAPFTLTEERPATVAVVQGDVPGPGNDILYDHEQLTDNHVQATIDLADDVRGGDRPQPDFVLWPENSTAVDPFARGPVNSGLNAAAEAIGVPVLVGGLVDAGPDHVLNQGIVWDPVTGAGERYTKWHPVVYGEYIPFRDFMGKIGLEEHSQLARIPRDMLSGTRTSPLRVGGIEVADSICFDVAYDDGIYAQVERGAELLTVQTSNASFIFTDQIDQQFAITRLRAIETGRWLAVASTNGLSGVIRPDGSAAAVAEPRTTSVLVEQVTLMSGVTPAVRLGAWPGRVFAVLTCLGLVLGVITYRRRGDSARRAPTPEDVASRPDERQPA
jgi:apolipoprotein N-acyltransferase